MKKENFDLEQNQMYGYWANAPGYTYCSACNKILNQKETLPQYCQNCGIKMANPSAK